MRFAWMDSPSASTGLSVLPLGTFSCRSQVFLFDSFDQFLHHDSRRLFENPLRLLPQLRTHVDAAVGAESGGLVQDRDAECVLVAHSWLSFLISSSRIIVGSLKLKVRRTPAMPGSGVPLAVCR